MIVKTKELAKVYYEVEYVLDENKMTQEEKEILKNSEDMETIKKIINKYTKFFEGHSHFVVNPFS